MSPLATYPYLHYAVFDGSDQGEEVAEAMNTWTDSSPVAHPTDFGESPDHHLVDPDQNKFKGSKS